MTRRQLEVIAVWETVVLMIAAVLGVLALLEKWGAL